ncbi:hypothetical protein CFC21_052532 [Triticum aestivum]|uniref:Uncharacterized protein n=2 Tax=Triticum aestivum TaxID=4565 RepID=A0A3B6BXZ2_WHEAT|nr:hypothetical protein CFC21_052532 [Triticum aestivum]
MGSCASSPRGFPEGEKPMVDDMPVTPKAVAAPVESDAPVVEAPLVDPSASKAEDACKVNEELIPVISELPVPMTEEAEEDTEVVVVVEEVTVAAEKQN